MDGWGEAPASPWNAVRGSHPEHLDALRAAYPSNLLLTSGQAVGLPPGQIGNSEVGHLCLGAGRIVLTDLDRISTAIADGAFERNAALIAAVEAAGRDGGAGSGHPGALHLMGLFSDGGCTPHRPSQGESGWRSRSVRRSSCTPSSTGATHLQIGDRIHARSAGASSRTGPDRIRDGHYYAMDRDNRWERVEVRSALVGEGFGPRTVSRRSGGRRGETDEFVKPR
jgi:2,3-bisphosphoglycerate-independent phosphoglycerate mutase